MFARIAVESFSDLRTVATERAPFIFTRGSIEQSLARAEQQGGFKVDAVSPIRSAREITVPTLIIHGEKDVETPPAHAQRIFNALAGPKRLILVPAAGHNQSLRDSVWTEIDAWIRAAMADRQPSSVVQALRPAISGGRIRATVVSIWSSIHGPRPTVHDPTLPNPPAAPQSP